jgi:hypothetical protein
VSCGPRATLRLTVALLVAVAAACGDAPAVPAAAPQASTAVVEPRVSAGVSQAASHAERDLDADERAGGHTLARHVGQTDEDLRARLRRERGISAASTWTDHETAARIVGAMIGQATRRVDRWAHRTGCRPNLALDWRGRETVGRALVRGAREPVTVSCAVAVLRWDTRRGDYYVLTSYPEVCR